MENKYIIFFNFILFFGVGGGVEMTTKLDSLSSPTTLFIYGIPPCKDDKIYLNTDEVESAFPGNHTTEQRLACPRRTVQE